MLYSWRRKDLFKVLSVLTHLYITPHPYVFGKGVKLFSDFVNEAEVVFENLIQVNENKGIYQYQYKVKQK